MLVRAAGTPLAHQGDLDPLIMVRTIATARIIMPRSMVRMAAGRAQMTREAVVLCFLAGANSIFYGEKLLTTPNPEPDRDAIFLRELGLAPMQLRERHDSN
jgi:biotin synthase